MPWTKKSASVEVDMECAEACACDRTPQNDRPALEFQEEIQDLNTFIQQQRKLSIKKTKKF